MPRVLRVIWALPTSVLATPLLLIALGPKGSVTKRCGALEVSSPYIAWLFDRFAPMEGGVLALCLGHVIAGRSQAALDIARDHEHVHVRQAERWGPAFVPVYLGLWMWLRIRGQDPYREHPFEREAYGSTSVKPSN